MKYTTCYTSSNGQPSNGHESHDSLNAALSAWESNIGSLLYRSGGDSTLKAWENESYDEPVGSISWIEYCEGGYACADGIFGDDVAHHARYEQENGKELTAEKVVRLFSE